MAHFYNVHNGADIPPPTDVADMADRSGTSEESSTTTAKTDTVEENSFMPSRVVEPMFVKAMAICPPSAHVEFEMDLWENRPTTEMEAINIAIILL